MYHSLIQRIFCSTTSIPLLVHVVSMQIFEKCKDILQTLPAFTLDEPSEEENHDEDLLKHLDEHFVLNDSCGSGGKNYASWLRVEQRIHSSGVKTQGRFLSRNHNNRQSFQVVHERAGHSLLRSAREFSPIGELIPPLPQNVFHHHRGASSMFAAQQWSSLAANRGGFFDSSASRLTRANTADSANIANAFNDLVVLSNRFISMRCFFSHWKHRLLCCRRHWRKWVRTMGNQLWARLAVDHPLCSRILLRWVVLVSRCAIDKRILHNRKLFANALDSRHKAFNA